MSQRRMFNKDVIETEWFTDMPATAQMLYIHLSMNADDDGFVTNSKMAMVNAHASKDDLAILLAKKYVMELERGLYLIKHWRQNNYLRNDRYKKSDYADRLAAFSIKEDGSYTLKPGMDTNGIPSGYQEGEEAQWETMGREGDIYKGIPSKWYTQDRIGEERSGKVTIETDKNCLKQPLLLSILIEKGFITELEATDPEWDSFLDSFYKSRLEDMGAREDAFRDCKVKIWYALQSITHYRRVDKEDGTADLIPYLDTSEIAYKFQWLRKCLTEACGKGETEFDSLLDDYIESKGEME